MILTHIKKILPHIILIFTLLTSGETSAEEPQSWLTLNIDQYSDNNINLKFMGQARLEAGGETVRYYQLTQRFIYNAPQNINLGVSYSFLATNQSGLDLEGEGDFRKQHRIELEANKRFKVSDKIRYNARNRFEFLNNTSFNNVGRRFRHRSSLEFANKNSDINFYYISEEIFVNFNDYTEKINQYRHVPIGVNINFNDNNFNCYLLGQSNLIDSDWKHRAVIGIDYNF